MPLTREHTSRAAKARGTQIALTCALTCLAVLGLAAPAMADHLNTSLPETAREDRTRTLSTTNGTWLGTDGTYSYAWQRCDSEALCDPPVPGQTASSYLLTTADLGRRIRSVVTTNSLLGPDSAASALTARIVAAPPTNSAAPAVSGATQIGSTLSSTLGTWNDPSPANVTYRRQWQRCAAVDGSGCQSISGATGASYTTGPSDLGQFARVLVAAEGLGTTVVASPPVGPIANPPGSGGGSPGGAGTGAGTNSPTGGLRKMRPFPRVIVAGRLARGLTFISGLEIRRGPRSAAVSVRCRGRGCPRGSFRGRLGRRGSLRLKRFQRIYGPGTVIEIRITRRGAIGKFTRLTTRSRSVPARRDACLMPGSSKPRRCPRR